MVIYQVYVRSFQDSDGDGLGDLPGVTRRLDHIAWLGADAVWLSPIHPSPMADGGYDVTDYTTVSPAFGTDADLDELIRQAHARGLKVLLDVVPCHTSIEHPWFREHPERYVWAPDGAAPGTAPNNWAASFGGSSWSADPHGRGTYLHSFYPEQPDLDWARQDVRDAFTSILRGWRARGVDGFRLDALQRLGKDPELRDDPAATGPPVFPLPPGQAVLDIRNSGDAPAIDGALAALRHAAGDDALLVGEVYLPAPRLTRYLEHLDAVFSFDLLFCPFDADELARVIQEAAATGTMAWTLGNHDFSRPATRLGTQAAKAMWLLTYALPGIVSVYQGDELGLPDGPGGPDGHDGLPPYDRYGRDAERHPVPWEQDAPNHGFTDGTPWLPVVDAPDGAADRQRTPPSTLTLHREALRLRRELTGPVDDVQVRDGVLHVRRGAHLIVVNTSGAALPLDRPALLATAGDGMILPPAAGAIVRA
jgi:alpha-glucosidase